MMRRSIRLSAPWVATLGLFSLTALAAVAVAAVPGLGQDVAGGLAFNFEPRPGSWADFAQILGTNARVAAALLLLSVAARRRLLPAPFAQGVVTAILALNAAIVGAAVGAYGLAATAPWLAHLPLEWAALATAASPAFSRVSSHPGRAVVVGGALFIVAAVVESYLTPLAL